MDKILTSFRNICVSSNNLRNSTNNYTRLVSGINKTVPVSNNHFNYLVNRNPRNLERMRISRKPTGYHLDKPGKTFWHKVIIIQKPRCVVAKVFHNINNVVIQASTNEWNISKYLFKSTDTNAYIILAQVLAERCLQSGIHEMVNGVCGTSSKREEFIKHFEEAGISLTEPPTYSPLTPWSVKIDEKPWKIHL